MPSGTEAHAFVMDRGTQVACEQYQQGSVSASTHLTDREVVFHGHDIVQLSG